MTGPTFHLVPHVHWDREWYLSRSAFQARLVPMMAATLDLLERSEQLRFHLDGQTILVADYLSIVPAARPRLERLVRRGQLGVGPWYVLADELIPSALSLGRNLEIGMAMAAELGGAAPVLYSPDAFGHPGFLPSLAAEAGIRWAVAWRGLGRVGGADRDLTRWVGPDGRSVILYQLPDQGYEVGIDLVGAGRRLAARWRRLAARLQARAVTDQIAVFIGADHHAPDPALPELADRIQALEPNAAVRFSTLAEYFTAVEAARPDLVDRTGELTRSIGSVWSLQGVHSTRARMKRAHSIAELHLARVAAPLAADDADRAVLGRAWRDLIECQFHDTIAGTTADLVAEEQRVRLAGVRAMADQVVRRGIHRRIGHDPDRAGEAGAVLAIWNPVERVRSAVVVAETTWFTDDVLVGPPGDRVPRRGAGARDFHLIDERGRPGSVQVLAVREGSERIDRSRRYPDQDRVDQVFGALWVEGLGGRATGTWTPADGRHQPDPSSGVVRRSGAAIDNGIVAATVERDGTLTLVDHLRDVSYPGLLALEDQLDRGDCYTPAIDARRARPHCLAVEPLASGPWLGAVQSRWVLESPGGVITGRTVVTVTAGSPLVRVRIELQNGAVDHRLRAMMPVGVTGTVLVGAGRGQVERTPGLTDRSWPEETGLPTAPGHRFAAAADRERGLGLLLPGFFEYQWTPAGELGLTLLRAVGQLSRDDLAERCGHAGWPVETPGAQEPGRHAIELALVPIDDETRRAPEAMERCWEDAFLPPIAFWIRRP